MYGPRRRFVIVVGLALLVAAAPLVASVPAEHTLVVADAETGDRLLEVPVNDGDEVTLAYTHSVEKTPVEDVYVVDGSRLRMDRMVFHSHGAGLPTGGEIERTDEGFVVRPNASYEELGVVPGEVAGHELIVDGTAYDLVARSDGAVRLFLVDRSLGDAVTARLAEGTGPDRAVESGVTAVEPAPVAHSSADRSAAAFRL